MPLVPFYSSAFVEEEAIDAVITSRNGPKHPPQHARLYRLSLNDHSPLRNLETPPQAPPRVCQRQFPSPVAARCAYASNSARLDSCKLHSLATFGRNSLPCSSLQLPPSVSFTTVQAYHRRSKHSGDSHTARHHLHARATLRARCLVPWHAIRRLHPAFYAP